MVPPVAGGGVPDMHWGLIRLPDGMSELHPPGPGGVGLQVPPDEDPLPLPDDPPELLPPLPLPDEPPELLLPPEEPPEPLPLPLPPDDPPLLDDPPDPPPLLLPCPPEELLDPPPSPTLPRLLDAPEHAVTRAKPRAETGRRSKAERMAREA